MILTGFSNIRPKYESDQAQTLEWLARAHTEAERAACDGETCFDAEAFQNRMEKLLSRYGCGPAKLKKRGHELEDFLHRDWQTMLVFNGGMKKRQRFYSEALARVFEEFYPPGSLPPDDMIHVTCTGYASPSGAQQLVSRKGWGRDTVVTHLYHMGCYAAFPALRVAQGFVSGSRQSSNVDIVHTELCTLHFNPSLHSPEQLVIQSLFADGFIRYLATSQNRSTSGNEPGLEVLELREEIVEASTEAMQWSCSDWGLEMVLSRDVPNLIATSLKPFLAALLGQAGWNYGDVIKNAIFAIHPGGPKIIEKVQALLEISDMQVEASKQILFMFGNMSSATLPHVWQQIVNDSTVAPGTPVVSLAFGPALTISGGLFRKV